MVTEGLEAQGLEKGAVGEEQGLTSPLEGLLWSATCVQENCPRAGTAEQARHRRATSAAILLPGRPSQLRDLERKHSVSATGLVTQFSSRLAPCMPTQTGSILS